MILGRWTPVGAFGAAVLFSLFQSLGQTIKFVPPTGQLADVTDDHRPGRRRRTEHPAGGRRAAVRARGGDLTSLGDGDDGVAPGQPARIGGPARRRRTDQERADLDRIRAMIDLGPGASAVGAPSPIKLLDDAAIADLLRSARRIAVVGASSRPGRPSHGVMRTLLEAGYEVVPVNPRETEVLGVRAHPDLRSAVAATGPVDIVDVFRRPELCVPHAEEAVAVGARCLWLQLGVVSREAARVAATGGLAVVMDRCTAIELRRLR
jgi:predicted CoA-binding protein